MSEKTPGVLVILLNGTPMLEYDRGQALSDRQRESLQRMEEKLDQGILLGERFVTRPERQQRVEYMAANLVAALLEGKDVAAAASCAYLAMALPELKQVRALEKEGTWRSNWSLTGNTARRKSELRAAGPAEGPALSGGLSASSRRKIPRWFSCSACGPA